MLDARRFYDLMTERGIKSLAQLTKKTKIPYTTLRYMLSGHDMYVSNLIELSRFFNVPIDDLINKNYGISVYKDDKVIEYKTTNIYEVLLYTIF